MALANLSSPVLAPDVIQAARAMPLNRTSRAGEDRILGGAG